MLFNSASKNMKGYTMPIFSIDQDRCRKDGLCAAVCPRGIIRIEVDTTFPEPAIDADEQCIHCGHCRAVCPHGALSLAKFDPAQWPESDFSLLPSHEQLSQLIRGRRSTRAYKSLVVERSTIERLINVARYAPTARNSQLLQWLVIDSEAELNALKNHTIAWMQELVQNKDPRAAAYGFAEVLKAWEEGNDPILRGAPSLIILHAPAIYPVGIIDSTIAMTTFELTASAEQIGTCWAGFLIIAIKEWQPLRDAVSLPDGNVLTTAMMVGYPKYRYTRLPERNAPQIIWR